jgi:hypothetical protein
MQVSGKIKVIQEVEEKGTFKSRNIVVTTEEQYPQHIAIQFVQDKCSILDSYAVGQSVEVSINLRGREWVDPQGVSKYFNTIQGWKINKVSDAPVAETAPVAESDLPF